MSVHVIKASGKKERFNPGKVRQSLLRAGADKKTADKIINAVESKAYDGIPTRKVFKMVMRMLAEEQPRTASCYDLKGAIMRLGPSGFPFETFISRVLEEYGYETRLRTRIKGKCATHEIDIVAEEKNGGKKHLIECKYHNTQGVYINLKEALYTYARFLDLNNGGNLFDGVWLSCNTRASTEARRYARCMGIRLLCWGHPKGKSLENLIEEKNLYPITVLRSLDRHSLEMLSRGGYMLVKDITENDFSTIRAKTKVKSKKLKHLVNEARNLCYPQNSGEFMQL